MWAVFRKELKTYFYNLFGYAFLVLYYILAGYYFFYNNLYRNQSDLAGVFDFLFTITIFLVPILTMRLFSEEYKLKTDILLKVTPNSELAVVIGKYLAAVSLYFLAGLVTLLMAVVVDWYAVVDWPVIAGNFVGLMLLAGTMIAIGTFVSALTDNQVIAAIGSLGIGFFLILVDAVGGAADPTGWTAILTGLSFERHYRGFRVGLIAIQDVLFFGSVSIFFLYLTVLLLENQKR